MMRTPALCVAALLLVAASGALPGLNCIHPIMTGRLLPAEQRLGTSAATELDARGTGREPGPAARRTGLRYRCGSRSCEARPPAVSGRVAPQQAANNPVLPRAGALAARCPSGSNCESCDTKGR